MPSILVAATAGLRERRERRERRRRRRRRLARRRRRLRRRRRRQRLRRLERLRRQRAEQQQQPEPAPALALAPTPVPPPDTLHLLNRLTYGHTPQQQAEVSAAGGPLEWFENQLKAGDVDDTFADGFASWFPRLGWTLEEIVAARAADTGSTWKVMADFDRWTLLRRAYSRRQVHEVMTELWSNLLHVPVPDSKSWAWRIDYDRMVRRHALGRFDDLLHAAVTHPAMLCYLDNARSVARNPNENLGRELLELHTVGRMGGYDERDVRDSTMILTGYLVDTWKTWRPSYSVGDHYVGAVRVLDFTDANASADGRDLVRRYTRHLAHHPATAQRIAHRLAVRFVSDTPPAQLVSDLKHTYVAAGTDIKEVLRCLVRHPDFGGDAGGKVRTPTEDLLATLRVLQITPVAPRSDKDLANFVLPMSDDMGQRPFDWGRPDGTPDVGEAWTSMSRLLGSWKVHANLAGCYWPTGGFERPALADWLPPMPTTFGYLVDHLSRTVAGRGADESVLTAAGIAAGSTADTEIGADHRFLGRIVADVLTTLLDSPAHMKR